MPRYREIYRLSVTCTFLDRPPQTSLRSYFFLPVFVTRILPRTSIRRTAPQHQILFPPWKAFPQSRVLNRVQFPPNRDFSKITRRRRPRRNEGGGEREREKEREGRVQPAHYSRVMEAIPNSVTSDRSKASNFTSSSYPSLSRCHAVIVKLSFCGPRVPSGFA